MFSNKVSICMFFTFTICCVAFSTNHKKNDIVLGMPISLVKAILAKNNLTVKSINEDVVSRVKDKSNRQLYILHQHGENDALYLVFTRPANSDDEYKLRKMYWHKNWLSDLRKPKKFREKATHYVKKINCQDILNNQSHSARDTGEVNSQDVNLKLGDTNAIMLAKMKKIGARDVTSKTKYQFYHAISGEQEYYWWELKNKTIVAVLLAGKDKDNLNVAVIEIGEPGKGINGIANWRSQKLTCLTSITNRKSCNTPNMDDNKKAREDEDDGEGW